MGSCCSTFSSAVESQFDKAKAASELAKYREDGPGPTTRMLRDAIARTGPLAGPLLDVGSGIGALTFELLRLGATRATAVDASTAYLAAGREEAARRGQADAIQFIHGDFLSVGELPAARVVTMDRVVCCYPLYEPLLKKALETTERCFAYSYPRDRWYVRLAMAAENGMRWLARNPFRTFVHPAAAMEQVIRRAGFTLSSREHTLAWTVDAYSKAAS